MIYVFGLNMILFHFLMKISGSTHISYCLSFFPLLLTTDNFPSRHSPYPWARTSDPTIQHCFQLQPTLPPSHPTLPRSFHQAASASSMRSTLVQDNGQDVKSNIGGSGGIVGSIAGNHKRKRSWSRAVFTSLQRKGLEKRFEIQKYVNKPERRQLASALGLSDAQVRIFPRLMTNSKSFTIITLNCRT